MYAARQLCTGLYPMLHLTRLSQLGPQSLWGSSVADESRCFLSPQETHQVVYILTGARFDTWRGRVRSDWLIS